MAEDINTNNIPILGNGHASRAGGFQLGLLMRTVDEDGTVEPKSRRMVQTPMGVVEQAILGRDQYVTAEELVEMIRQVIKEEIADLLIAISKDE